MRRGGRVFGFIPRLPVRTVLFLAVGLGVTALGLVAYGTDVLRNVELDSVDARFSVRGTQKPPKDLIVVQIDDVTFNDLHERWPFPRTVHARAIDHINADHPKAIAYDVQFTEPSNGTDWNNPPDLALADAITRANGRVVLSTTEVDNKGGTAIFGGDDNLRQIHAHPANGLFPNDPGGVIRRASYAIDKLKTFAVVTTEVADHRAGPAAVSSAATRPGSTTTALRARSRRSRSRASCRARCRADSSATRSSWSVPRRRRSRTCTRRRRPATA